VWLLIGGAVAAIAGLFLAFVPRGRLR
jgi:gas vesicle protein